MKPRNKNPPLALARTHLRVLREAILKRKYRGRATRGIHVCPVLSPVPFHRCREEPCALINAIEPADFLRVSVEYHSVCTGHLDADAVVREALSGVEVEDEHQTAALKDNDLVGLVLERNEGLRGRQPSVLGLTLVHQPVEVVEKLIAKEVVVCEVKLTASVPEGVVVALTRKVKPLRVAELVALEVEVTLASKAVSEQADHLVQGHATIDHRGEWAQC